MTRFDPATYPGRRPDGPVLVYQGREWPVTASAHARRPVIAPPAAQGAEVLTAPDVRWIVAYGANASPDRLIDKLLDLRGAILVPARVHQWGLAWEARRTTSTGAVPLTIVSDPGATLDTWVLGIHPEDIETLDRSEGRGGNYVIGRVGHVAVAGRYLLAEALAYGPGPRTRLLTNGAGDVLRFPPASQADASKRLIAEAAGIPAPPLHGAVRDAWPPTPFDDLDVFVYGTLKPGMQRWAMIRDLVEVLGEAATPGWLRATFYGWPAAGFEAGAEHDHTSVHGYVLRPHDAEAAEELYRIIDEVEDVPNLFQRVAVRIRRDDGATGWAAACTWADSAVAPGTVVTDGRWRPG